MINNEVKVLLTTQMRSHYPTKTMLETTLFPRKHKIPRKNILDSLLDGPLSNQHLKIVARAWTPSSSWSHGRSGNTEMLVSSRMLNLVFSCYSKQCLMSVFFGAWQEHPSSKSSSIGRCPQHLRSWGLFFFFLCKSRSSGVCCTECRGCGCQTSVLIPFFYPKWNDS